MRPLPRSQWRRREGAGAPTGANTNGFASSDQVVRPVTGGLTGSHQLHRPTASSGRTTMLTVREAFFEVARQLGLTTMFGNPGSTEEPFLKDFPDDFHYVLALQEASVIAMADAYAQRTGRPTLVNVHTAAGMGNAV